jgi:hypothetical protein
MVRNWIQNWLTRNEAKPRRTRQPGRPRGIKARPVLELLEGRLVPSIVWTNRGSASDDRDGFNGYYHSDAGMARQVIDQVIADWNHVVGSFNYRNVGQSGWAPTYDFALTVSATTFTDNTLGKGGAAAWDGDRKPYAGSLRMDNDGAGQGWYFDPFPQDNVEFSRLQSRFAATSGDSRNDFYTTALHEIGHALGIALDGRLRLASLLTPVGTDQITPKESLQLLSVNGFQATFTTVNGGHLYEGAVPPGSGLPTQPNDLMNRSLSPGVRRLISDTDARVLQVAYGYTVTMPSTLNTFLTTVDALTGVVKVNAEPGVATNSISLSAFFYTYLGQYWQMINVNGAQRGIPATMPAVFINGGPATDVIDISSSVPGLSYWINTGAGDDTVRVTVRGYDGYIGINNGGGNDNVTIGTTAAALGYPSVPVTVQSSAGSTQLTVDGSVSPYAQAVTITSNWVTGLLPAPVFYAGGVTVLNVNAGSGGNTIDVQGVAAGTTLNLSAGGGKDTVRIRANDGPVNVVNGGDADQVIVGYRGNGALGSMQAIGGPVSITSTGCSQTDVVLDNRADAAAHRVTMAGSQVSGLGRAPVSFNRVMNLTILSGAGDDVFDIQSTPAYRVNLSTGDGYNTVYVRNTSSELNINSQGVDRVIVGYRGDGVRGSLLGIGGAVNVTSNASPVTLIVDASGDPYRPYTITGSAVLGLPAAISYGGSARVDVQVRPGY